jgi:hypothetical protein
MDEHFHTWLSHQGPIEIKLFGFNVVSRVANASLTTKAFDANFMHKGGWYVNNQIPYESTLVNALNWTYIHL